MRKREEYKFKSSIVLYCPFCTQELRVKYGDILVCHEGHKWIADFINETLRLEAVY